MVFALELHMTRHAVGADAEHNRFFLYDDLVVVAKRARLRRSAGRIVLRVKVKNHRLSAQVT